MERAGSQNHAFNVDAATKYGVYEAIMLNNLVYWIQQNAANERHCHEGSYWTYNSAQAFQKLFPYFSEKQIRTILAKLEKSGLIKTGNFNHSAYDRTKWYALTDEAIAFYGLENSICPNGKMEAPERENGSSQTVGPIPNINTDVKTNGVRYMAQPENQGEKSNEKGKERKKRQFKPPTLEECRAYHDQMGYTFDVGHFYAYYQASDWHKGDGKKVSSWKQCMVTFERNQRAYSPKQERREPVSVAGTAYDF